MTSSTQEHRFGNAIWRMSHRCRRDQLMWDRLLKPLTTFLTSPTTLLLASFTAMMCKDYLAPTMNWNTALGSPASTSDEPQVGGEPFLAWWSVVPFVSLPLLPPSSTFSRLKTCDLAIISAGGSYAPSCSRVSRRVGSSSASVKIRLLIWLPSKPSFSSDVFRSAFFELYSSWLIPRKGKGPFSLDISS